MNKKFSTLMAGLLLAGGAFSNAWATDMNTLINKGKYIKVSRTAFRYENTWQENGGNAFYLTQNGLASNASINDLWKIEQNSEGIITLVNIADEALKIDGAVVGFDKIDYATTKGSVNDELNLFYKASTILGNKAEDENGIYPLQMLASNYKEDDASLDAFDAVATNLQEVADFNANAFFAPDGDTYVADGGTYYLVTADGELNGLGILKLTYNKNNKTWSFTKNGETDAMKIDGEVDFSLTKVGDDVIFGLPSKGKYVTWDATASALKLVDSIENATIFAVQQTGTEYATVGQLNFFAGNGFNVTIKGLNETTGKYNVSLAGNPFVGHLTPMAYVPTGNGSFKTAEKTENHFYLKNEDGKYIVAERYSGKGFYDSQALYKFVTISEDALIENLKRAEKKFEDQKYFGDFAADVSSAVVDADPKELTEIEDLYVLDVPAYNGKYRAALGRYDFSGTPTLSASVATTLIDIQIKLGSNELVDMKKFLQKGKFYTVVRATANGTDNGSMVATNNGADFVKSYGNELEGQWAAYYDAETGKLTFTNRENIFCSYHPLNTSAMYYTDAADTYRVSETIGGKAVVNTYVIKPVEKHAATDGYERFEQTDLNRTYHIAYASSVFNANAYLTENHDVDETENFHVVGLDTDDTKALTFTAKEYSEESKVVRQDDHTDWYYPTDSIYVISTMNYWDAEEESYIPVKDTLKVVTYSFVNQWNEPLVYEESTEYAGKPAYMSQVYYDKVADEGKTGKPEYVKFANASLEKAHKYADKFALRKDGTKLNLRPVEFDRTYQEEGAFDKNKNYQVFRFGQEIEKVYAGDASLGVLDRVDLYDRTENDLFVVEETSENIYRRLANNVDTVSIYRNYNEKSLLYEKTTEIADDVFVNFLGMENIADFTKMAPAMIADTAYVRNETYKPQYMLIVDPTIHPAGKWCEEHQSSTCEHAVDVPAWTEGRILVNLVDSAKAWDEANKHQVGNPYKNTEGYYKLGFVPAIHRNDSLIVNGKRQFIGNNDNHIAKFQFRYADTEDKSFVIETSLDGTQTPGYLKWMNGVVVVVDDIKNADIYNMNEDEHRNPTANETISAGNVVVAGTNGAVVVKGAEGKNVIVSTILGKVVANEVVSSDNAQIATPAGIVVVSVDGESFKVVVK